MSRNNLFAPIAPPQPAQRVRNLHLVDTSAGKDLARKTCFAILNGELGTRLVNAGLSTETFWNAVKAEFNVVSYTELDEKQFVLLAARLTAAQDDNQLFDVLCGEIRAALNRSSVRVYCNDKKIYEGEFTADIEERCQAYADKVGVPVRLHGTDGADGFKWVDPQKDKVEKTPPAVTKRKRAAHAFEVHQKGNENHFVEVPFPVNSDLSLWGQNHANMSGYDVEITDSEKVVIMSFQTCPSCCP